MLILDAVGCLQADQANTNMCMVAAPVALGNNNKNRKTWYILHCLGSELVPAMPNVFCWLKWSSATDCGSSISHFYFELIIILNINVDYTGIN